MITIKRSCSSSNRIEDDKIVFNSFTIILTNDQRCSFEDIHRYLHDDDNFDRVLMVRTLEEIIDTGIYHLGRMVYDEITPQRMVNE